MDAIVHKRESRPDGAGGEVPDIFLGIEHVLREIKSRYTPQRAEIAGCDAPAQFAHNGIAAIAVGDGADTPGLLRSLDHAQAVAMARCHRLLAHDMGTAL